MLFTLKRKKGVADKMKTSQKFQSKVLKSFVLGAGIFSIAISCGIVIYILARGIPNLNLSLFSIKYTSENSSLFPALINTLSATAIRT